MASRIERRSDWNRAAGVKRHSRNPAVKKAPIVATHPAARNDWPFVSPSTNRSPGVILTFEDRGHDVSNIKENATGLTGGCQCGAVRYQLLTPPEHACICHCRMCQRASGQPFMAFASVKYEALRWMRGHPSRFVSSNVAERNFCSACGTPLTYHRVESGSIAVTIGRLDVPEAARPVEQFGTESELSWTGGLRALPAKRTEDWMREYGIAHINSHQSDVSSSA